MTTSRWDRRWPSRDETGTLATLSVVSHHHMSRPSQRCGRVGSFWPTEMSTWRDSAELERDLLARVGRADDKNPTLGQLLRALVVGAVKLVQLRVELVAIPGVNGTWNGPVATTTWSARIGPVVVSATYPPSPARLRRVTAVFSRTGSSNLSA